MKHLFFAVFLFLITNPLFAANFTVIDFMALDGAEQALVSGAYDTFTGNFKPAGFTQISKFKVRKTAQDMGIQLSTASPQQMKPVMDKLKVTHIVFGKVRKINSEYVVTASFIKAGTNSPLATEEAHFSGSHVEPVKALAQNLAKKLRGGNGGGGKAQAATPAKVLNEPGIIYGFLKVFPKDLGPFPNDPEDIINNINAARQFGYNTWRVPTENELALLFTEGYIKNAQGYMSDANSSGKLRLVTDKKTAKELEEEAAAEEASRSVSDNSLNEASGLQWSNKNAMKWDEAVEYCKNLNEGGFSDWRLPTIAQLRDLVTNCPGLESNGGCGLTDDYIYRINGDLTREQDESVYEMCSCPSDESGGSKYSKFGDEGVFWSSTIVPVKGYRALVLGFHRCGFKAKDLDDQRYFRCVRFPQTSLSKYVKMSDSEAKNLYMQARALADTNTEKTKELLLRIVNSADMKDKHYEKAKHLLLFLIGSKAKKIGGLMWSERYWNAAKEYCEGLSEGGFSDWRLPNIDELRTIIENCPKTEPGGECKVSERSGCLSFNECYKPWCSCFCHASKVYSKFGDENLYLWSSSHRTDEYGNIDPNIVWNVHFAEGDEDGGELGNANGVGFEHYVRCVRE